MEFFFLYMLPYFVNGLEPIKLGCSWLSTFAFLNLDSTFVLTIIYNVLYY
jgi:hypothetical protein